MKFRDLNNSSWAPSVTLFLLAYAKDFGLGVTWLPSFYLIYTLQWGSGKIKPRKVSCLLGLEGGFRFLSAATG